MRTSAWVFGLTAASAAAAFAQPAGAVPVLRRQVDQRGDFVWIGNTIAQDCAAGARLPVVGTIGNCGNQTDDTAADVFCRSDSPADGQAEASVNNNAGNARSTA